MTTQPRRFDDDSAIARLASEAGVLADTVEASRPSTPVPLCPDWTISDLAIHVAGVFRWVTRVISDRRADPPAGDERRTLFADPDPADFTGIVKRLRQATDGVVTALADAPEDIDCWTIWSPPASPRQFWVRRLLFETLIHRVDAENAQLQRIASGRELDAPLAADGIDEIVCGFARRYTATLRSETEVILALRPTDALGLWWARIGLDEPTFGRGEPPAPASAKVSGTAGELLLLLWNRRDTNQLEILGDPDVLRIWRAGAHL